MVSGSTHCATRNDGLTGYAKGPAMIRHIVLLKLQPGIKQDDIEALFDALANLGPLIPGMRGFDGGISVSPEKFEQGFDHGFCIDFEDAASRDAYLEHPEHQKLGGQLVGMLEGGLSGLVVFDLDLIIPLPSCQALVGSGLSILLEHQHGSQAPAKRLCHYLRKVASRQFSLDY